MKFFCIPGGGTPASVFFRWKAMLKKHAEIIILDYPGRDILKTENAFHSAKQIAEFLFTQMQDQLSGSYGLLSSCTGCMIAYELYQSAKRSKMPLPEIFLAFSAFAPDSFYYAEKPYLCKENQSHIKSIYQSLFNSELFSLPEQCAQTCSDFLICHSASDQEIHFPEMQMLPEAETYEKKSMLDFANRTISMILYDWRIAADYANQHDPFSPMHTKIYAIRGQSDKIVSEQDTLKWKNFTDDYFDYKTLDGGHNLITSNADSCIALLKSLI